MPEAFPMNGGDGTYSYAKNSEYQVGTTVRLLHYIHDPEVTVSKYENSLSDSPQWQRDSTNTLKEMINKLITEKLDIKILTSTSNKFYIADLGCSVGPNTFLAMHNVVEAVEKKYLSQGLPSQKLEFQVFFNDHASNDFNTLFASLPPNRQYYVAGVPGSFYDRLFPESSLHFVYSSYALQWFSKVPEELLDEKSPAWNKGRITYTSASDEVANAYAAQFEKDMEIFLNARAKEIVAGGMMVLVIPGLPDGIHRSLLLAGVLFDYLGSSLTDMVNAGLIKEDEVDSFNLPLYAATPKEMTEVVEKTGCFSIERMEITDPKSKLDGPINVQRLIMHLRAGMEGIFTKHFGPAIIDDLFERTFQKTAEISSALESSCYNKGTQLLVVLKRK